MRAIGLLGREAWQHLKRCENLSVRQEVCLEEAHPYFLAKRKMIADQEIDDAILANVIHRWRKVARVVGSAMSQLGEKRRGRDDLYFAQRVLSLVQRGLIEAEGDLEQMGRCEVRLPGSKHDS